MLIAVVLFAIAFSALWQSYREPQVNLSFLSENATALVFLGAFLAVGLLLARHLQPFSYSPWGGVLLLALFACWAVLTGLWFWRKHPNDRKPPDFVLAPLGPVDQAILWFAGFCVVALIW